MKISFSSHLIIPPQNKKKTEGLEPRELRTIDKFGEKIKKDGNDFEIKLNIKDDFQLFRIQCEEIVELSTTVNDKKIKSSFYRNGNPEKKYKQNLNNTKRLFKCYYNILKTVKSQGEKVVPFAKTLMDKYSPEN